MNSLNKNLINQIDKTLKTAEESSAISHGAAIETNKLIIGWLRDNETRLIEAREEIAKLKARIKIMEGK